MLMYDKSTNLMIVALVGEHSYKLNCLSLYIIIKKM